jgi:hypothetical protein
MPHLTPVRKRVLNDMQAAQNGRRGSDDLQLRTIVAMLRAGWITEVTGTVIEITAEGRQAVGAKS